jgi:Flp pilus assembly protein TadG
MKPFLTLIHNARGTATIEFALASLFLFGTIMVALDFGYNVLEKQKLGGAVQQAAILAYNQHTGSDTSAIKNYVVAAAGTQINPTVAITCNGTSTCGDGKCSCLNGNAGFIAANSCNATCAGSNAISGNYMKIVATSAYKAVIVPDQWLGGTTMTSTAVLRLQ